MSERRRWRLGQCFGPHPSHKRSNEMSDLIDRWRKGRAEFYTEDSMYSIGDKMAAELEAVKAREEARERSRRADVAYYMALRQFEDIDARRPIALEEMRAVEIEQIAAAKALKELLAASEPPGEEGT